VRQWADFGVVGIGPLVLAPLSEIQGRNPVYFISFFITASKCTVKTMLMGSDVYSAGDVQEYSDHLGCSVCIWIECVGGGDDGRRDDIGCIRHQRPGHSDELFWRGDIDWYRLWSTHRWVHLFKQ